MLGFTDEHNELRASVRRFVADRSPSAAVRQAIDSDEGFDPAVWRQMASQPGLPGLAVPQRFGGAGYGSVELGIVLEETGRALLPGPLFATVALAGQALVHSSGAGALAAGHRRPVAHRHARLERAARHGERRYVGRGVGEGWQLTGSKLVPGCRKSPGPPCR